MNCHYCKAKIKFSDDIITINDGDDTATYHFMCGKLESVDKKLEENRKNIKRLKENYKKLKEQLNAS
jgi:hypothetical protein